MATNKKHAILRAHTLRAWLLLDKDSPLLYEKEIIYQHKAHATHF